MATDNDSDPKSTVRKFRSPAYPFVSLPEAIGMAEKLWNSQRKHEAHFQSVIHALGYNSSSGPAQRSVGALGHYGLTEDSGRGDDRKMRLSEIALDLLQLGKEDPRYRSSLRIAALKPTIHAALWERYGSHLPGDESIRPFLLRDKGYSDQSASEVLKNYRETFQFANLGEKRDFDADEQSDPGIPITATIPYPSRAPVPSPTAPKYYGGGEPMQMPPVAASVAEMPIPIAPGLVARIPTNLSEDDFDLLLDALTLYKKRIVTKSVSPPNSEQESFEV